MPEHVVRITWLHEGHPVMYDETSMADERQAWRVFMRLCDLLRALVNVEARRQEGGA